MSEKKFPLSETFCSPQGEGLYAGAMMQFVRLAGCSVGKKIAPAYRGELPVYTEKCTTHDGREFLCDTDFRTKRLMTAREIIEEIPEGVERICITGGEPLNYDLTELLDAAYEVMLDVHIETSGTVKMQHAYPKIDMSDFIGESVRGWIWLTVCPKLGCLDEMVQLANEIKLLVDKDFDAAKLTPLWLSKSLIYIQPINEEFTINKENLQRCLALQKVYPHWRISSQAHKLWEVR
jgi:7-carboxy-7-deazaguanine synthase